ncbi:lytic transglycosylase domain-containing protein [Acetobacter sacchari]|uniref:Lytic transglycosylase domain-containing protein n=1 Tax=Acetobacter sacchari TaxID=2661687 RepID=A0ABS3LYL0_9PROT|nr:lytic transglycosylase domain-containing protein [Acetobacter sacchari]MBO1360968.1 lytic transglycosylase domain-containing protein [Acetobacter sacchari]
MKKSFLHAGVASAVLLSSCAGAPDPADPPAYSAPAITTAPTVPTQPVAVVSMKLTDRLTVWRQLVAPSPGEIPASTYAQFLATKPVWPHWKLIETRFQKALADEPDDGVARSLCASASLNAARALSRCVAVLGATPSLRAAGRAAWRDANDGAQDAALLRSLFAADLSTQDNWARFQREERSGQLTAASQTAQLLPADLAALATARVAFHRNDPGAEALLANVPAARRSDPVLALDRLRWLRKAERLDDALALWKSEGMTAERRASEAGAATAFWTERDALARALLAQGRDADAFAIADDAMPATDVHSADAAFLSGWIALRRLHDATTATQHFTTVAQSRSLIVRSGGYYWLGRARTAAGDAAGSEAAWRQASQWPQTFYGQMAISALAHDGATLLSPGSVPASVKTALQRFDASGDPVASSVAVRTIASSDLAQAARILVAWGDKRHAREFLTMLLGQTTNAGERSALAAFATRLGLQDVAVAVARRDGREGLALPALGWPAPVTPPPSSLPPGFALGLMRQESSFDPEIASGSGAIGLMQLLPGTARDMARLVSRNGGGSIAVDGGTLRDPSINMQLGTTYLGQIYDKFGGVAPYAAAGYNAGPHRVSQWLESAGDPARTGGDQDAMLDWIETIPYTETRGYVMRVWENMTIYAVKNPS